MFGSRHARDTLLICVLLGAGTLAAFWPLNNAGFVNIDDPTYITENFRVQKGLSAQNVEWAFQTFYFSNWHPLTWLSYLLDCQLFGPNAAAMHRVNLGFHVANALLLFFLLKRMTAATWASGIVAAFFSWHPLHVESVAWISERKDVLSTLFWLLTMWAYVEYVRRRVAGWYAAALLFFVCGLMSKAMLVTLPFVLLLIDIWPLERISIGTPKWIDARRLLVEKIPFFLLSAAGSFTAFLAQQRGEAMTAFSVLPFAQRVANALVSYARYLEKTFWPTDLAVFYPHPYGWSSLEVIGALLLILGVSSVAVWTRRHSPFLFAGWFWFVGTLVPVIGLVQVGSQSMADRYTYVPLIGLFIAFVWSARALLANARLPSLVPLGLSAVVLLPCAVTTYRQTKYWKDSVSLFSHAARVTAPNSVVLNNLGGALLQQGETNEANARFRAALQLDPEDFWAWGNVGNIFLREGKWDEAIEHYRSGLRLKPNSAELHYNLGLALAGKGAVEDAIREYERSIECNSMYLKARLNLGNAYLALSKPDAAATNYLTVLELNPSDAAAHYNLGNARLARGRLVDAINHFSEAVRLDDPFADAHRQLAAALEQSGRKEEALKHLERAVTLKPNDAGVRAQLGGLLASMDRTEAAIARYREALKLNPDLAAVLNNLAWTLATHPDPKFRDGAEAVRLAERAVELTGRKVAMFLGTLGAAYAEAGRFAEAVSTAEAAIKLAESQGEKNLVANNEELLKSYQAGKPWREAVRGGVKQLNPD